VLICGTLDKVILGGGNKDNLFHVLMRDYGPTIAADRMSRLARLCARWIGDQGFSIGISDVTPSVELQTKKESLLSQGYTVRVLPLSEPNQCFCLSVKRYRNATS